MFARSLSGLPAAAPHTTLQTRHVPTSQRLWALCVFNDKLLVSDTDERKLLAFEGVSPMLPSGS